MTDYRLLINGTLVPGASLLDVINPATEEVFAKCARADAKQLEEAVAAAKAAFKTWSKVPLTERAQLITKLSEGLMARQEELARVMTAEQGKPLPEAMGEVAGAAGKLAYFATLDLPREVLREDETVKLVRQRTPLGVVAAITPWNFPLLLLMLKVGPALLAGNTVVAKPAPSTPLTTLMFGEICAEVLPPGVVNVIVDANDLGGALTGHPDVAKVAFTGSTETGKKVMESISSSLKRLTLELGGNDAAVVLDDADPKEVAPKVLAGAMRNAGQVCLAIKRLYVTDNMYDEMCDELVKHANEIIVDDGEKQGTQMGPLQNKMQFEKVLGYLENAKNDGTVIAGGAALGRKGYFIAPTIVRDIPESSCLVQEEQFGPILPVLRYSNIDDLIERVNATEYGLGGSVWSKDTDKAVEIAARMDSGTIWVNKHMDLPNDMPFGGAKQSGFGLEMGQEGLEEYTQSKIINIAK